MKQNNTFETLKQIIDKHNNLLVISHLLPDGDNIGSVLGLTLALKAQGKNVIPVVNGEMPQYYRFLPHNNLLVSPEIAMTKEYDLVICVDMSDQGRGGDCFKPLWGKVPVMNIDHHYSNDYFGDYNYVDSTAASCTQILTEFFLLAGYPITKEIATAFYVGLLTDSGSFTYESTSAKTLKMGAALMEANPDLVQIRMNVFENVSFIRKKILGQALNNAQQILGNQLVYSFLSYEECQELQAKGQDFEGIIDHLIGVTNVKMAIFFREMEKGKTKVGFRGKPGIDVTVVAGEFGGGGHQAAGGCHLDGDFQISVQKVLDAAKNYLEA